MLSGPMGKAEEFIKSFFAAFPHAKDGNLSLQEVNALMAQHQKQLNRMPVEDFDGLSPELMGALLYSPFSPAAAIQFRKDIEPHVEKSPFFKLSEFLLDEVTQAGSLKLTANGNLPVRVCEMLCNQNLIHWHYMKYVKRIREDEIPYLWPLKQYLLDQGLVKKRSNALSLTRIGVSMLTGSKTARFVKLFLYMGSRFHWGNFYVLDDNGQSGQSGWAYSLFLLSKYGDRSRKSDFYSLKAIRAFEPELHRHHQNGETVGVLEDYHHAYQVRFFECFANWFGLIDSDHDTVPSLLYLERLDVRKSFLFDQLFTIDF